MGPYDDLPDKSGPYDDLPDASDVLPAVVATQPEGGDGFLAKVNAALRKPSPYEGLRNFEDATRKNVMAMAPHDLPSYLESLYMPAKAARQAVDLGGQLLQNGDVSGIPLVGRIPEIAAADETPALSEERIGTAERTLMDLGMLAGGGERAPVSPRVEPQPPPIPPEYAERRFTMQEPPPEPVPDIAPSVPIEQQLPKIQPPVFNPELGPAQPLTPEFQMPAQTETALMPGAEAALRKEMAQIEASIAPSRAIKQRVSPKIEERLAKIKQQLGMPPDVPVNAPGGADIAPEAPGGVPVAEPAPSTPALEIPEADRPYAGVQPTPGIANRVLEEQIKAGTLPEDALVQGKGTTPEIATARARAAVAKDPNVAFEAARRVHRGEMHPDDPAILHAYNDQLAEGAAQSAKASIENPGNPTLKGVADAAEAAHMDFLQNVLPKAKGQAQRTLVGFQGATPPDYATYAGMLKELGDFNEGKGLTPAQRMQLYKRGMKGERLKAQTEAGLDKMQQTMDRTMPKTKTPNQTEMRSMMEDFVEKVTPCE